MTTSTKQHVILGPNGPAVPALGIGTWAWGDSLFWGYGKDYGARDVESAFWAAIEAGVNFFDTAEIYGLGESESLLGRFMQKANQPIAIATKYFPLPWRFGSGAVAEALTASLKRLQVNQVALYQVHWPFDFFMGQETLMNALADEVQQKRILSIGVSNYSAAQMRQAHAILAKRGVPLAVNQVRYSLLTREVERNGVMATAQELGMTLLAYSPLAQGLLTGKYGGERSQISGARKIDPRFSHQGIEKIQPLLNLLNDLASRYQRTSAQVALNWLIAQGNVIPIPGAKTARQAQENAGALGWMLAPEDVAQLTQLSTNVTT
jgi:aryl-alcohol dehydrogenase-like predicted oxidoreductase